MPRLKTQKEEIKVDGNLRELVTIHDEQGKLLHKFLNPLRVEFKPRDFIQIIIGSAILAIPVGFTEEVWNLGATLPMRNVAALATFSLLFISLFIYYTYYRGRIKEHWQEFAKRVLATYLVSFLVVGLLLTIIERAPWSVDFALAAKRTIIVSFPASMSAAVADMIK